MYICLYVFLHSHKYVYHEYMRLRVSVRNRFDRIIRLHVFYTLMFIDIGTISLSVTTNSCEWRSVSVAWPAYIHGLVMVQGSLD